MPNEILKVKGKQRTIDDAQDGIVYKTTMVFKEGKKGEPTYRKWQLVLEEGAPRLYKNYEPDELLRVAIDPVHQKLDEFQQPLEEEQEENQI